MHLGRPENEEQLIDKDMSQIQDGESEPEEGGEEYEVETVPNNDNDWRGEGIHADDDSDSDDDSECLIDIDTDIEDNNEEYIEVWYAKAKLFLDHVNKFSRTVCDHPGFNLSLDYIMIKLFKGRLSMNIQMGKSQ